MIGLIDADHIPYTICYNKKGEPEKSFNDCIDGVNKYLSNIINKLNLSEIHLFFTLSKCFRYNVNSGYKAGRSLEKPSFFYEVRDYLVKEYKGISHSDLEADDLISIYKEEYQKSHKAFITISPDKDMLNLYGTNYDPKNDKLLIITVEKQDEYFWKSVISGDSADAIKGIPGKGKAYADKVFNHVIYNNGLEYAEIVFSEYLKHFGEKGIEEFYKNYKCLKILNSYEGIEFQEPLNIKEVYARSLGVVGE